MTENAARMSLWPLFLVSGAAVGFEIALTRYFAVATWSEYGYWVISIVMAGFALSGVAAALAQGWLRRRGPALVAWLPPALVVLAALGFWGVTANPFNPLQLQNPVTFLPQLGWIALYYAVLLPFFFLAGLYISLVFVLNADRVPRVYGFDLMGAGAGAATVLALMLVLHPFRLVPALLVPLAVAGPLAARRGTRGRVGAVAGAALLAGLALLMLDSRAAYNEFKSIYAPLHVPGAHQVAQVRSPRGLYALLDDFTERVDVDLSNDAGMLHVPGPPSAFGLYRDGTRIAALAKPGALDARYASGTLDALPYLLLPHARVLLAGASGGFRIQQALVLGAAHIEALEPEPVLRGALLHGLGPSPALPPDPRVRLSGQSLLAAVRHGGPFDLIDVSGDFLDQGEANAAAYSAESITRDLQALAPGGLVSIPVSIRELPVYAVRVLATVRRALRQAGVANPAAHVLVYRSAWNLRVLVGREPWTAARIAAARRFCDDRSFDVSYYPGIDVAAARANIYNDLPAVSFEDGAVTSGAGAHDAVADEAGAVLRGEGSESQVAFDLRPITLDRPAYYSILRLERLPTILARIEVLPQAEVAPLVNLAVLGQALLLAVLVLAVPLLAPRMLAPGRAGGARTPMLRPVVYFMSLGLGFLFIEIVLIEKASFYLGDRTSAFALVLTGMLVFSGAGSLLAGRMRRFGIGLAGAAIVLWCVAALWGLEPLLLATIGLPWAARALILLAVTAPVSAALGMPFPLGLARFGSRAGPGFLPWAWAVNGAFSVVATPAANLLAIQSGFDRVLLCAAMLYAVVLVASPSVRKSLAWQPSQTV